MIHDFSRNMELLDGFETGYLRLLYYDLPGNFRDTYKSYENVRLCTVLEGEKEVKINDGSHFTYDQSEFVLLPSHSTVDMNMKKRTRALVLEMDESLLKSVSEKISIEFDTDLEGKQFYDNLFVGQNSQSLRIDLDRIVETYMSNEKDKGFLIDVYAQKLAYDLLKTKGAYSVLNSDRKHPIHQAICYIRTHLYEPLTVKQLAWMTNMSESSFSRTFKQITGLSPSAYVRKLKLLKAKELLEAHTVTEVCYELGYENISYFIKLFKSQYGVTPKQYTIQLRNK